MNNLTSFTEPDQDLPEGRMLQGWLNTYRDALQRKCSGLNREQLRATPISPSNLSLLGLVRHLTEMERVHLVHGVPRTPVQFVYYSPTNPEADFEELKDVDPAVSFERWTTERAAADAVIAPHLDGDHLPAHVRFRIVKVIGEYARHAGHADLLRERLDGATGE